MSNNNYFFGLSIRYFIILLLSINALFIIYYVMSPITYYLSLLFLGLIGSTQGFFLEKLIVFNGLSISLVDACVAGAAYYLLLVLCLTTQMNSVKRLKAIFFSCGLFLVINVFRITIFSLLAVNGSNYFGSLHLLTWYFLSVIIVVGVWLTTIRIFVIKGIPVWDDIKRLLKIIKKK